MFRTVGPSGLLFELLLPPGMRVLSGELAQIDDLLDDPRFFRAFRSFVDPTEGRPSIPMETYLRLLFLKVRFELGCDWRVPRVWRVPRGWQVRRDGFFHGRVGLHFGSPPPQKKSSIARCDVESTPAPRSDLRLTPDLASRHHRNRPGAC